MRRATNKLLTRDMFNITSYILMKIRINYGNEIKVASSINKYFCHERLYS